MEFENEYSKPSSNLTNKQYVIDLEKTRINAAFKATAHDTIEAGIILTKNIGYYKTKYELTPYLKRHAMILKELQVTFPNLDIKTISKVISSNGFYSERIVFLALFSSVVLINLSLSILLSFFLLLGVGASIVSLTTLLCILISKVIWTYLKRAPRK